MPPSRSLLQYSCRGFICQSCMSKLLCPRRPWASRNITSESGGQAPKKVRPQLKQGATPQSDIRYFDEKPDGTREEIDPGQNAAVIRDLDQRIAELQAKVEKVKSGELSLEEQEMEREMSELTDEQRMELIDAIGKATDPRNDPLIPHPTYNFVINYEGLSEAPQLETFVRLLKRTALGNEFTPVQQKMVWKHYTMVHRLLINISDRIPTDVWTFLWTVFAKTAIANPQRLSRLKILAEDMEEAGIILSDTQLLVYMEAWYLHGQRNSALDRWRSLIGSLGKKNSSVFRQFWEMGIRMLAMNGHPQEALDATAALFRDDPDADPRIVIPIIASWISSNDDQRLQKAWVLYRKLRSALSGTIEMKDFDAVVAIFLGGDLPGLALGVFRDMMTTDNQKTDGKSASTSSKEHIFASISLDTFKPYNLEAEELSTLTTTTRMKDVDWTAFDTLAYLPHKIRNKFFFGSWIKKLLGEKEITGALQVIELMRKYHIRPYAIQLNGVVGALLRSKAASSHAMGEKIAWNMIKARSEFVAAKERKPVLISPMRPVLSVGKKDFFLAVGDLSCTPPATQETLALLIENYRRRGIHSYVQDLWNVLGGLKLRPNTYILNQFLLSYHRARQYKDMEKIYYECVDVHHVRPDLDTIKWLWMFVKQRQTNLSRRQQQPTQASTRRLFITTIRYLPLTITTPSEKAVMAEIYDLVMMCFSLLDDQIATAIAIRAFQQRLGLYPEPDLKRRIIDQVAASDGMMKRLQSTIPSPTAKGKRKREIQSVVLRVEQKRTEELKEQGIDLAIADKNVQGEERIYLLTELLKSLFNAKMDVVDEGLHERDKWKGELPNSWRSENRLKAVAEEHVQQAAEMMGVPDIKPWDY